MPQFSDLYNGYNGMPITQCHECKSSRTVFSFIPVYASGPRDHIPALTRQSLGLRNLSLGVLRGLRVWGQEEPQFNCYSPLLPPSPEHSGFGNCPWEAGKEEMALSIIQKGN